MVVVIRGLIGSSNLFLEGLREGCYERFLGRGE